MPGAVITDNLLLFVTPTLWPLPQGPEIDFQTLAQIIYHLFQISKCTNTVTNDDIARYNRYHYR